MRAALTALVVSGVLMAAELGQPSPDLTILREGGPSIALKQYLGKTVLLAFIQSPSLECQSLIPMLSPISRDYAHRGVQVLVVAFDESAAGVVPKLVQRFQPPYPVGWTNPKSVNIYFQPGEQKPKDFAIPRLVFIDRKGIIRGDYTAEKPFFKNPVASIRSELDSLLR